MATMSSSPLRRRMIENMTLRNLSPLVKIVVWDTSSLVMYWKRLDSSGFKWPPTVAGAMRITAAQLSAFLVGMHWTRMHAPRNPQPKSIALAIYLRCIRERSSGQ